MGKLIGLLILIPLLDLFLLIKVGSILGFVWTLVLVILVGVIGAWLAKRQGIRIWRQIQLDLSYGNIPGNEMLDGALIFAGALLLLTPGFLSDLLGIGFLLPVSRRPMREALKIQLRRMLDRGSVSIFYRR